MYTTGPVNFRIFFNQSRYKDTKLLDTCDVLPIYIDGGANYITRNCIHRNNNSKIITDDYHKKFGNYVHNKWSEGSGCGNEQLQSTDSVISQPKKAKRVPLYVKVIIICIICIIYIIYIIYIICIICIYIHCNLSCYYSILFILIIYVKLFIIKKLIIASFFIV